MKEPFYRHDIFYTPFYHHDIFYSHTERILHDPDYSTGI
jgi:hypothetical protein